MTYIMTIAKALALSVTLANGTPTLAVGDELLCPDQTEGVDDEELECRVVGLVPAAGVAILRRVP